MDKVERKKLLVTMKTCCTYMKKVAQGLYGVYGYDWRVAKMDTDVDVISEMIEELERNV